MNTEFKVTKKLIEKLEAQPIEVRVWNGWFRKAVVEVKWYGSDLRLEVSVGHPILSALMHPSWKDESILVHWKDGYVRAIPEELQNLKQRMVEAATITDEVAKKEYAEGKIALRKSFKEMGLI